MEFNKNKKVKILFAIGRMSAGGAEKLLAHQLRVINKNKFDPYLLTLFPEQKESFEKEVFLDAAHWKRMAFSSLFDLRSWFNLRVFLRKEKFDVVVTSLFSANLIVRLAAISAGVPVIASYEHNLYPDKRNWQIWADWFLAGWTDIIFTDAQSVKDFTARQEGIDRNKFFVLYHPPLIFEKPAFSEKEFRKKFDLPANAKIILTVSRLVEEKGHSYLIDADKKVLEKYSDAYFLLVGWGPLENSLKLKVKSEKLERRVILTGRLDIKDILPYADIYVEPAVTVDIGIALLEAMKEGKPIVSSRVGEIPVFVKDGENGFLVEPKNSSLLAGKISELLADGGLRKKFGENSKKIISPYTIEGYLKTFEEIVSSLIKKKK